jgi:mannosyltransferase OCH1-like enzyme
MAPYVYAHHADVIRLDVLARHGGMYADMDTIFVNPVPDEFWSRPFLIGMESGEPDHIPADPARSLCNALMMARPGSEFVEIWRSRIIAAMDGTWSNHSCELAAVLATGHPDLLEVEPERSFTSYRHTVTGIHQLVQAEVDEVETTGMYSVHLWAHLWWERHRQDFSTVDATWFTEANIASGRAALCHLARPHLLEHELW